MANEKISDMPTASSLTGTELVPLVQNGMNVNAPVSAIPSAISVSSPDSSLNVAGSPGGTIVLTAGRSLAGAENVVPGQFLFAGLPPATAYPNMYASTSDLGAVYSLNGTWQQLYNVTSGSLKISTNPPLPAAQRNAPYSLQLTTSGAIGSVTWLLISQIATTNSWTLSPAGILTGTPTANEVDTLFVQATDSTNAVTQKIMSIATVTALTPAATPVFSPVAGTYPVSQSVVITCSTAGSTIYYTTNGSTPTTSSAVYSSSITVGSTQTVQAIATASGFTQSATAAALYTISASSSLYMGLNTTGVTYFTPEQPFLNIFKQAGSNSRLGWFTSTSAAGLGETNEEGWLALDANGYITSLTATNGGVGNGSGSGGRQQYAGALTFINDALSVPPGATTTYPTGSYTIQFQGQGTMILSGDVTSGTLASTTTGIAVSGTTITSTMAPGVIATVTFSVAASTQGIHVGISALPSNTNYFGVNTGISIVQTSLQSNYAAGEIFHPLFKATWGNISACRMMWWNATIADDWILTFVGGLPMSATSGTMSGISGGITENTGLWPLPTGSYNVVFQTGQIISVNFTYQSAAVNWTTPLSAAVTAVSSSAEALTSISQSWAKRKTYTSAFWDRVPYEVQFQFCNELGMDPWVTLPAVAAYMDTTFSTKLAQLAFNGTGTTLSTFGGVSISHKAYIEYSNEVWNSVYAAFNFSVMLGILAFPTEGNIFYQAQEWYGTRVAGICDAFKAVYGSAFASRVIVSMGGQTAAGNGTGFMNIAMNAPQWVAQGNTAPYLHGIGGMHFAPYFTFLSGSSGVPSNADIATILNSANPLNTVFGLMYSNVYGGNTYSSVPSAGIVGAEIATLTSVISSFAGQPWATLPIFGYEGGSQWVPGAVSAWSASTAYTANQRVASGGNFYTCILANTNNVPPNATYWVQTTYSWLSLLTAAARDPRMGYVLYDPTSQLSANPGFLPSVKSAGMKFLMFYVDVYADSAFGVFGLLESITQTINPLSSAPANFAAYQNYIAT